MNNYFKYIFIAFIVIILVATSYIVFTQKPNINNLKKVDENLSVLQNDLRLAVAEIDTFNPILSNNKNVYEYSKILYSQLVTLDEEYKVKYDLAKEIIKEDNLTYKILLRDNVFWYEKEENPEELKEEAKEENSENKNEENSNNNVDSKREVTLEKLTANDVRFTLEQISKTNSLYKYNIENISEITVNNDNELIIKLSKETPFFEYNLTFPVMKEVEESLFNNRDTYFIPKSTGKYVFEEKVNNTYHFVKNPKYYEEFNPNITSIYITAFETMGEVYNSFKSGNIDLVTTNEGNTEQYVGTEGHIDMRIKGRDYTFLAFNNEKITDSNLKKGIAKLINQDELLNPFGNMIQRAFYPLDYGTVFYSNVNENTDDTFNLKYNKDVAKLMLEEAGYKFENSKFRKDSKTLTLNVLVNEQNSHQLKLANRLKEILANEGIDIIVTTNTANNYYKNIESKNYDLAIVGIRSSYNPSLERFLGENNLTGYINESINNNLKEIQNLPIGSVRNENIKRLYTDIEKVYLTDVPFIGLTRDSKKLLLNLSVTTDGNINLFNIFQNIEKWYRK